MSDVQDTLLKELVAFGGVLQLIDDDCDVEITTQSMGPQNGVEEVSLIIEFVADAVEKFDVVVACGGALGARVHEALCEIRDNESFLMVLLLKGTDNLNEIQDKMT